MSTILIKRLKADTGNNNLPVFGEQEFFDVTNANNINNAGERVVAKIVRGGYFLEGTDTTHKSEVDTTLQVSIKIDTNPNRDVYYTMDMYKTTAISGVFNFDNLKSSYSIKRILCSGGYKKEGGAFVTCTGSVNDMGDKFPNLEHLYAIYMASLTGSILGFAKCTKARILYLGHTVLTGALEDLASSQIANGRVSGSLAIQCNGTITYNGEAVPNEAFKTITYNGNSYTIS